MNCTVLYPRRQELFMTTAVRTSNPTKLHTVITQTRTVEMILILTGIPKPD
jgi:hypothetical protein